MLELRPRRDRRDCARLQGLLGRDRARAANQRKDRRGRRGRHQGGFTIVRYLRNGRLDAGFGKSGKVMIGVGAHGGVPHALAVVSARKILVAGDAIAATTGTARAIASCGRRSIRAAEQRGYSW
jgi:hypothetical protein